MGRPGPFSRRTEASPFSPTTSTSPSARAAARFGTGTVGRIAHAGDARKHRTLTPRGGASYTPPHDGELPAPSLAGDHDGPGRPERAPRRGGGGGRARRRGAG